MKNWEKLGTFPFGITEGNVPNGITVWDTSEE